MAINMLSEVDKVGLIHAYNLEESRPQDFMEYLREYGKTTYRSTYWINFNRFSPFSYFIVLFAEAGSGGNIPAWGLCERPKCKRVKSVSDSDPFLEAEYGFPGDKERGFKSLLHFITIGFFQAPFNCSEFTLIKNKKPITDLRLLRTALYVDIPANVMDEIKVALTKVG